MLVIPTKELLPWKTTFGDDKRFERVLLLHDKQKTAQKKRSGKEFILGNHLTNFDDEDELLEISI